MITRREFGLAAAAAATTGGLGGRAFAATPTQDALIMDAKVPTDQLAETVLTYMAVKN